MKNIVNYLDEFIDEENGIYECTKHNISDMKDRMKAFKRGSREEEIEYGSALTTEASGETIVALIV